MRMGDSQDLDKLEETARSIVQRFRAGLLLNEKNCRQYAIDPLLAALGWNRSSKEEWIEEFPLPDLYDGDRLRWVDYALCDGGYDRPKVFVEAKELGGVTKPKNKDQLFGYGNNRGVPLLVLTDGITWRLYFALGKGLPTEREFDTVHLVEEPDGLPRLINALGRAQVVSGSARRYAEEQQIKRRNAVRARNEIPDVWRKLISGEDMAKALFDKVREYTGLEPLIGDVRAFLNDVAVEESTRRVVQAKSSPLHGVVKSNTNTGRGGKIDKERAREMLRQGMKQSEVARHFSVAPSSVRAMVLKDREREASENAPQTKHTPHAGEPRSAQPSGPAASRKGRIDKDLARQMLRRGATQREVAQHFGVSRSSVSAMVQKEKRRQQ